MRQALRRNTVRVLAAMLMIPIAAILGQQPATATDFTAGNLVVLRAGSGAGALSNVATAVFLDEYTPAGALVRSIALPTAGSGANRRLTVSGSATSEGELALSADGRYLTFGGYDADPGTASVATSTSAAVARVVGRVDANGTVDTSTAVTDTFSGGNIRGAVSDDGSRFWVVGSTGGVRLVSLGSAGTTTQINSAAPTNIRTIALGGGRLLVSTGSAPTGVYGVGSGLPVTGGQTPALLAAAPSPYGIVALDRDPAVPGTDTLYVADDSASPNGGILKYSFDGTTWTARGSVRPSSSGVRGLTGSVNGSGVTLFATTSATASQLVKVDDTAAFDATISATSTVLQTSATNTAMRGVAFAPAGGTSTTAPAITTQPQDATVTSGTGTTLTVAATGTGPLTYQWYAGTAGDTSTPIGGATGASYVTSALTATSAFWVRVSGPGGQADSRTATVTVSTPPPACTGGVVTIGSVQGTGEISPVAGTTVTVRGTVVGDYEGASPALRGFYLQDAGDGNPSTSDAVFVFDGGANLVSNGDVVEVTGSVSEFQGQTQITSSASGVNSCGTQATVPVTDVTLPRASADDLEPFEGMLVRLHQTLTVTEHFQLGRFGQVVVSSGGKLRQPTADIRATDAAAVAAAQLANNLNRLIIDDANQAQNPDPIVFGRAGQPLSASNTLRGGDTVTDAVGVLTYTWAGNSASGNAYRLRPLGALGGTALFEDANPRPTTPPAVGTGSIKVASANLLNFFNTYTGCKLGTQGGTTDCRGATSDQEYQRQLAKEVASLRFLGADVIGYMEMENDGYGSSSAVQALVNALNAADGPGAWAFVNPDAATGVIDSAGTDAIKAGIIYRTASVQAVPGATFADQNSVFERRPVAQTFQTPEGSRFSVVANHFKSKGSCPASGPDADQGDGQSCWNPHRTEQATELVRWINDTVVPGAGDPDVMIVGDLNAYAGEDPIAVIEAAGYTNLVKAFHGQEAYSYVFDGQWGYLDYVLSSSSLTSQVTGASDAHHNSDEPSVLDYNTDFKSAGQISSLYAPDRFRTSDHDPVLAGLALGTPATVTGTPPAGTVGEPYSFAFTVGGTSPTVTLASGDLPAGVTLDANGVLSGAPTAGGDFGFTVRAANAFGTADHAVSIHVAAGTSATTLTAGPNPVAAGSPVTLTATVTAAVAVGGTVSFRDGATPLGEATVGAGGVATLVTSALAAGQHTVTATYSGSASLLGSTSDPVAIAVIDPVTLGGTLPAGTVGAAYSASVGYTGGSPVTFTASGTLPTGLTLSAAGDITGTPTVAGSFAFTVTATNSVSTVSRDYTVTIGKAATSIAITAPAGTSTVGAPVRFTATVTGPAGTVPGGTVQFAIDGTPLGGPVALTDGTAVSSPISSLAVGSHQVTATYSGSSSFQTSAATATHVVWYAIKVISPAAGSRTPAGSVVPVVFQITDAAGNPIPLLESLRVLVCQVRVSVSGAQTLAPSLTLYDPFSRSFVLPWFSARRPAGAVTIAITVTYPDAPTQQVTTAITLS